MKILTNGYYIVNKPEIFIDACASGQIVSTYFQCYCFDKENYFATRSVNNIYDDFYKSAKEEMAEFLKGFENTGPIKIGKYIVDDKQVFTSYTSFGKTTETTLTMLSPEILLDEDLNELRFKYVLGIAYNEHALLKAIHNFDFLNVSSNPLEAIKLFNKPLSQIEKVPTFFTPIGLKLFLNQFNHPDQLTAFGTEVKVLSDNGYLFDANANMFIIQ